MIVVTGNEVVGASITEYIGVVIGTDVRSHFETGFLGQGPRNIGPLADGFTISRKAAFSRMVDQARELGADAVLGMRYDSATIAESVVEISAHGTAVKLSAGATAR